MADSYKVNGKNVSKAEYDIFVAASGLPAMSKEMTQALTLAKYNNPAGIVQSQNAPADIPVDDRAFVALGERIVPGVTPGAEAYVATRPIVIFKDTAGNSPAKDLRVRILVPPKYITNLTAGPNSALGNIGGIIFPYTPSISFEAKAEYSSQQPVHSNFPINFYQKSSISSISVSGRFSVETEDDALMYLSTMHLLKSLTKMRFGADPDAGAPPPVCRLFAYGEMMLDNVPVAITNYRIELPDSVDYFAYFDPLLQTTTSVPTMSTIAVTCLPMYSRNEMQKFSVSSYNDGLFGQGYI
jgi:hypothetical protein